MNRITTAAKEDLAEILELQRLAFRDEAELLGDYEIAPLSETLEELEEEFRKSLFLKASDREGRIIGTVRGRKSGDTLLIGRLAVHPMCRGRGLGTELMRTIQDAIPHERCELFTSSSSVLNLRMYERLGFVRFREERTTRGYGVVYLQKYAELAANK